MATPMAGEAPIAHSVVPLSPPRPLAAGGSAAEAPVLILVYFHKAIRAELEGMHAAAVRLATERAGDVAALEGRCRFLFSVYRHHCDAEDAVIFPALDIRVKNVAGTYSLEHNGENDFFAHLFVLLQLDVQNDDDIRRELASCTGALQTFLTQHMSKEEEQVFPLLIKKFSHEEQADLVWQFLCSIPVNMMAEFLPWLSASVSPDEHRDILDCLRKIVPEEKLLQEIVFAWIGGKTLRTVAQDFCDPKSKGSFRCQDTSDETDKHARSLEHSKTGKRKCTESSHSQLVTHPIDEILYWHNAVRSELSAIAEETRNIQQSGDFSDISAFNVRLQFIADVCVFHSIAEDQVIFPAVDGELSFVKEHADEEQSFNKFRCLIQQIQIAGARSTAVDFYSELCSQADQIMQKIERQFNDEETKVLPEARINFSQEKQRELLYRSLCVMPLKLLERVLPWFAAKLNDAEVVYFLQNMQLAAPSSETALVSLLSGWACKGRLEDTSNSGKFVCLKSRAVSCALGGEELKKYNKIDWTRKHNELLTKLQGMCKSIRVTLSNHVHREELELWPLFDKHFSIEEQDKIIGRIIGTTGAEVLQSMLPWVTSALSLEEQNKMLDTWRQATKNTMFDEWLNEWWKGPSTSSGPSNKASSPPEESHFQGNLEQSDQMFKPGWKDIFRMNQSELEAEIRKVSRDSTLDPRRKAYLIQNLMTSRWIASQQKSLESSAEHNNRCTGIPGCIPSYRDPDRQVFGCEHYKRNCKVVAVCCNKLFTCRFCHDEVSDHTMERKATMEMMCMLCLKVQPVGPNCQTASCNGLSMAKYYCSICKFFDDERTVYHCPFCNLCRLGEGLGTDFFHCMKCNCCLSIKLIKHKCREKMLEMNCPICCNFIFTSSAPVRGLPCGHFIHSACFQAYTCTHYTCPICCKSLGDMTVYFGMLDDLLAAEQLPEEYRDRCQDILCNDCERKGRSRFHWLYHKCGFCGSYNTRVIKTDTVEWSTSN
ncbi:zinc finger protein BRUTUS-like isoform X2 [Phragmites australis]|uniref:zinc finger protein BRUTUS-like isoform X2 n=1 Tax=Phragmites australis TaxID=29695 RepID=UPI002D7798B6|nr:zinc finger protein BRUTUS-like isoform X2 [Phragmites australis]